MSRDGSVDTREPSNRRYGIESILGNGQDFYDADGQHVGYSIDSIAGNGQDIYMDDARQLEVFKQLNSDMTVLDETVKDENDRFTGHVPTPRHRKPGPKKKASKVTKAAEGTMPDGKGKPGPKKGYKRGVLNAERKERKKPGPQPGFKRGKFNKDGSIRQKPGPKPKGQHADDAVK